MKAKPSVTLEQFGRVVPNDWPFRVPAKFMLAGKARDFWYVHNMGKAPHFAGQKTAEKAVRRLYREFGHTVTPMECQEAFEDQEHQSQMNAIEIRLAMIKGLSMIKDGLI